MFKLLTVTSVIISAGNKLISRTFVNYFDNV